MTLLAPPGLHGHGFVRRSAALAAVVALVALIEGRSGLNAQACSFNSVTCENLLPGAPASEWDIVGAGDPGIQGFATDISVNRGQTIGFKIDTDASAYRLDIFRMGYYGGMGARKVATVLPSAQLPQSQPACLHDFDTGLIDCGNWAQSASWIVPSNATSGLYFAKAIRTDTGGASHIVFVVRRDGGQSDILFQTADTTWQAYNNYGGNSLYTGSPAGRAYKVSYNRPFITRETLSGYGQPNWVFWAEYPMVRWLEANGYDVEYFSGVDADRRGADIANHDVYMTVGHDEYWSAGQRQHVENARNAGVHMAFFAGNFIYWKTRWETAIDGSGTPYRTLVAYKETLDGAKTDPTPSWTGTWRDPRFSPPSDGGRPENALAGTIFVVNRGPDDLAGTSIEVPAEMGRARIWRNTTVAALQPGQVAVLSDNTLGYEWDTDVDNGARPAGLIRLSLTTEASPEMLLQGYGAYEDFGPGTATHHMTMYRQAGGGLVFSTGTVQWPWGLDTNHDGAPSAADVRMRQATVNLLADMGAQPVTLQADLSVASASTDTVPPVAAITYPSTGLQIPPGVPVTVTGTASDNGGGIVAGVEVSLDGGQAWHPAEGRESWTYAFTPLASGPLTIRVRAVDDSANPQAPAATVSVSVVTDTQAPLITGRTPAPGATNQNAGGAMTVTFNEVMMASSVSTQTVEFRTPSNQLVAASVSYDATTRTASLQPLGTLAFSTTYTARVRGGANGVKDFSGNPLAADSTWTFTTWSAPPCPCNLWPLGPTPGVVDSGDGNAYELGVKFRPDYDGYITGLRYYRSAANTGTHSGHVWSAGGTLLGSLTFSDETAVGWQEAYFDSPVAVTANALYVASYHAPNGRYSIDAGYFGAGGVNASPLRAPSNGETGNGVFKAGASGFPNQSYNAANYWVDVVYLSIGGDVTAPSVTATAPASGAAGVSAGTAVTATFGEAMAPASTTTASFELRNGANQIVPATVSYSPSTRTATLRPAGTLAFSSPYFVTVRGGSVGVRDLAGNAMTADATWSFATGLPPLCPCGLWDPATAVPVLPASADTTAYELGVRFRPELDGYITGVRFYKGTGNSGVHVGNLWSATGQLIASATFSNETATGWQEVSFGAPVAVSANALYVASYHAPNGHYAFDAGYFSTTGVSRSPLYAPAAFEGGNGVFKGGASGFPNSTYNATNYWVDVVYVALGGDSTAPTITVRTPADAATGVPTGAVVSARFNEPMTPGTVSGSSVELRGPGGQLVPAVVTYDGASRTAMLDPSASLAFGTTYQVRVKGGAAGVADLFGNRMAGDVTWAFTTGAPPACPCSLWTSSATPSVIDSGDGGAYELGVRFRAEVDGLVTGIRFYKSAANVGTHVGHLWSSSGAMLGSATFTNESALGWQEVAFPNPVAVTAGEVYIASYWVPNGHYSLSPAYFANQHTAGPLQALSDGVGGNGVFRPGSSGFPDQSWNASNYWVDVVLVVPGADFTAPTVTAVTPAAGAAGVEPNADVQATFSEAMTPASISTATFELRGPGGALVAAAVSYDAVSRTATFNPAAALATNTTYSATIRGGTGGVADLAGNTLQADHVWTFTTDGGLGCPCHVWSPATAPSMVDSGDGYNYELGVKFVTQVDGYITGVRFYKSAANVGTHTGSLWTSTGVLLATGTFTNETASGWQELTFAAPVPVTAGITYIASYYTPNGRYSVDPGYFHGGDAGTGPVRALGNANSPNGVFNAGGPGFPTGSYSAGNYWIDVTFVDF